MPAASRRGIVALVCSRALRGAVGVCVVLLVAAGIVLAHFIASLGPLDLAQVEERSIVVSDREGRLLRAFTTPQGRWRLPVGVDDVDPRFITLLTAYEDRRFRSHFGIDVLAMMRAAAQVVLNGRVVSGGSTLTMQVARLLEPREEASVARYQGEADLAKMEAKIKAMLD